MRKGRLLLLLPRLRCAMYTRKSTEEGLEQEFTSLAAQREVSEAFILSQRREGWLALPDRYDDRGFTGANMNPPVLGRAAPSGRSRRTRFRGGLQSGPPDPVAARFHKKCSTCLRSTR
jgi:hypothetical protein